MMDSVLKMVDLRDTNARFQINNEDFILKP